MSITQSDIRQNTPAWRRILHDRGLSDATIHHFRIGVQRIEKDSAWTYPVREGERRKKAKMLPSGDPENPYPHGKYRWSPTKPPDLHYYDPDGKLAQRVQRANGVLYLATGEVDVWSLWEAGVHNATCTLMGEGAIPAGFIDELQRIGTREVRYYADCDTTGRKAADKLYHAFNASGVRFTAYQLPGEPDSGEDINALLQTNGAQPLLSVLESCDVLPEPDTVPPERPQHDQLVDLPSSSTERAEVERRTRAEIAHRLVKRGKKVGYYECPLEHGPDGKDFLFSAEPDAPIGGCQGKHASELTRWVDLAAHLDIDVTQIARDVAREYRKDHTPTIAGPLPPVRHFRDGMPLGFMQFLNGAHLNQWFKVDRGDVANRRGVAAVLYQWYELVTEGTVTPDQALSASDLETLSADRRGLSYATINTALERGAGEFFEFCTLYKNNTVSLIGTKTQKNRGRPGNYYRLRPISEAWQAFIDHLEPLMWRALMVHEYPDVPAEALDNADWLITNAGATYDDIGAIDDMCQPLYVEYDAQRQAAVQRHNARIAYLRGKLYDDFMSANAQRVQLPEDVTFSNVSEWGRAIRDREVDRHKGVITDLPELARTCGVSYATLRRENEASGILTVPEFGEPVAVASHQHITQQAERLSTKDYARGRIRLYAPDGEFVHISPRQSTSHYGDWLDDHGGIEGAHFRVWERTIAKQEDLVTENEHADRDAISARQTSISEKAKVKRERATEDGETPKRLTTLDKYMIQQGQQRAVLFNLHPMPEHEPEIYTSGVIDAWFPVNEVWRGIVQTVHTAPQVEQGGEDVIAHSHYTVPDRERDTDPTPARERERVHSRGDSNAAMHASEPKAPDILTAIAAHNAASKTTHEEAQRHECHCGQPADINGLFGWQCAECAGVTIGAGGA